MQIHDVIAIAHAVSTTMNSSAEMDVGSITRVGTGGDGEGDGGGGGKSSEKRIQWLCTHRVDLSNLSNQYTGCRIRTCPPGVPGRGPYGGGRGLMPQLSTIRYLRWDNTNTTGIVGIVGIVAASAATDAA